MPIFEIEAGGKTFEVDAPDQAAALAGLGQFNAPPPPRSAPTASGSQQVLTNLENLVTAGKQGTEPNIAAQQPNFLGQATVDEEGNLLYKDQGGNLQPTDTKKHVALLDPADNKLKVYARSEGTERGPLTGVARVLEPGLGAGAVTARPGIAAASKASIRPLASDTMATAKPYYRAFEQEAKDIAVPGPSRPAPKDYLAPMTGAKPVEGAIEHQGLGARIRSVLDEQYIPEQVPAVYAATKLLDKGNLTLDQLQNVKQIIGKGFASSDKNIRDASGIASKELMKIMGEVSPSAAKNLRTADEIHQTALAQRELQNKGAIAGLRAGAAGYGGNSVNTMRQVLKPIVEASIKGQKTLFRPDEIAAMNQIVEGTGATNALRLVGQASPSKGIIPTMGAMGVGAVAGPTAAAIPTIGAAANKLATILTGRQIERLKDLVAKRSPAYSEAVQRATERYIKAQTEFAQRPTPARMGAYISASRALSSGLTRDGVTISSGDLIRAIQGPVRGAAEDEQPEAPGVVQ